MKKIDDVLIRTARRVTEPLGRIAIFVVYFWFGALKVFGVSPASPLVEALLVQTLPFISPGHFLIGLGIYECVVGIVFLLRWDRLAMFLFIPHMVVVFLPLVLLPNMIWDGLLRPTIEGQYILKNLALIALAFSLSGRLTPQRREDELARQARQRTFPL